MLYLPGVEVNHAQEGGSSRVRPGHCTTVVLTPTITPNVGNSERIISDNGGLRSRYPLKKREYNTIQYNYFLTKKVYLLQLM